MYIYSPARNAHFTNFHKPFLIIDAGRQYSAGTKEKRAWRECLMQRLSKNSSIPDSSNSMDSVLGTQGRCMVSQSLMSCESIETKLQNYNVHVPNPEPGLVIRSSYCYSSKILHAVDSY